MMDVLATISGCINHEATTPSGVNTISIYILFKCVDSIILHTSTRFYSCKKQAPNVGQNTRGMINHGVGKSWSWQSLKVKQEVGSKPWARQTQKRKRYLNLLFQMGSHKRAIVQGQPQRSEQQGDVGNNGFAVESQQTRSPQSVRNTYTLFLECMCLSWFYMQWF